MNYYVIEAIGWSADALFLLAYFLVSTKRISGEGKAFNFLNLTGAMLFGTYAVIRNATPVFILEIFWGSIALTALYKAYRKRNIS